jgi:hypothetical protein
MTKILESGDWKKSLLYSELYLPVDLAVEAMVDALGYSEPFGMRGMALTQEDMKQVMSQYGEIPFS